MDDIAAFDEPVGVCVTCSSEYRVVCRLGLFRVGDSVTIKCNGLSSSGSLSLSTFEVLVLGVRVRKLRPVVVSGIRSGSMGVSALLTTDLSVSSGVRCVRVSCTIRLECRSVDGPGSP